MTRRGSPEERRWRRNRNLEPGSDGSVHGEQPVDPRGRAPREKPSGHRHRDPQPAKEHGSATHDGTVADNPHGNATHSPPMVENAGGSPSSRRDTRANQPAPGNVAVGSEYRVKDEAEVLEAATDTDGDGVADTWKQTSTRGVVPTQYVTAADSRDRNIDNSDWQANATDDHVTIQNAVDSLPVGTK